MEQYDEEFEMELSPLNKLIESGELEEVEFVFYYQPETEKWVIVTGICSLGGCPKDFLEFETEQEAYDEALKMTKEGKEATINYACPACLSNYHS